MKIGQTFKYRFSGGHADQTLIILAKPNGQKYLWWIEERILVGEAALLNAKIDRVYTKNEISAMWRKYEIEDIIEKAESNMINEFVERLK